MSEILGVIGRSRDDEQPVFDLIVTLAKNMCGALFAGLVLGRLGDECSRMVANENLPPDILKLWDDGRYPITAGDSLVADAILNQEIKAVDDMADTHFHAQGDDRYKVVVTDNDLRSNLYVPLILDGEGIGCLVLARDEVRPYRSDEIQLVESFAAQAVIAIENARQFREIQTANGELGKRLEREAATREILTVISRSRDDEAPVFDVILENAVRLCGASSARLHMMNEEGTEHWMVAARGASLNAFADGQRHSTGTPLALATAMREARTISIDDLRDDDLYRQRDPTRVKVVEEENVLTFLAVPLVRNDKAIGCFGLHRKEVNPFKPDEIALVETFASQAVIAIENVRQFREIQTLNASLEARVEEQVGEIERMGRLKRFLPQAVADAVVSSGSEAMLKSHRALIGILFADIRGFTAFCEQAEPEETIEVLQTYHEEMGKLISAHAAGVDHRSGDGIMVIFNDPLPCDDPANEAVRLAVAMRARMAELCREWRKLGHRLGFGVGISLGYATVGMVGSEGRYEYTASGTAVNLAARLCDQAADGEILLSPRAFNAVEDDTTWESGGEMELKGLAAPVEVRKVLEFAQNQSSKDV